jgi:hypothetical protein
MPYTIPEPLKIDQDDQLPVGRYTTYIPWYDGKSLCGNYVPISFSVNGYTKSGSMKITLDLSGRVSKDKITRKRKCGTFMIPTKNEGHEGKQVVDVYPYHKSIRQQEEKETYDCVAGEAILFHPDRSGWLSL